MAGGVTDDGAPVIEIGSRSQPKAATVLDLSQQSMKEGMENCRAGKVR